MPIAYNSVGQNGTYVSTTPRVDLDGAALAGHTTFVAQVADEATVQVRVTKDATNWAIWLATFNDEATDNVTRVAELDAVGTISNSDAVEVELINPAEAINSVGLPGVDLTVTTTNPTVTVNRMHYLTIAGLTANRTFELPAANVGDRIGVYIIDGDPDYEIVIQGATGVKINNGTAATEWSRLYTANEVVVFYYRAANEWVVERDGRLPSYVYFNAGFTHTSNGSEVVYQLESGDQVDARGWAIDDTNDRLCNIRRGGAIEGAVNGGSSLGAVDKRTGARLFYNDGADAAMSYVSWSGGPTSTNGGSAVGGKVLAAGDYVFFKYYQNDSSSESCAAIGFVREVLTT